MSTPIPFDTYEQRLGDRQQCYQTKGYKNRV